MARGPVDPGERDRLVTIQQRNATDAVDDAGAPLETWTTLVEAYASKRDLRGNERLQASQVAARFDTVWTVNYRSDMDPELVDVPKLRRLVYQGRAYDIVDATQGTERRATVDLMTIASSKVA